MKKLIIGFVLWLVWPLSLVQAESAYELQAEAFDATALVEVDLVKVVDGDTAYFLTAEQQEIKARFLLIDTPELRHPQTGKQPLADEAKERVAELLAEAEQLYLEYDIGARLDKYQRDLVYVWADDVLVQEVLAAEGLADVTYIYPPNTRYLNYLEQAKDFAQAECQGLWGLPSAFEALVNSDTEVETASASGGTETTGNQAGDLRTVYIAPLSGSKYHLDERCRGLKKAVTVEAITLAQAQAQGYDLCGYEK